MRTFKWIFYGAVLIAVALLLSYSLPSREVVYITGQDVKRRDTASAATDQPASSRDVNYIYAARPDGSEVAYRNEDTDWGWPPYFKFDTTDLSARAANSISSREDPKWVIVTHYGWRLNMFSMFENLVSIRPAEGPDQRLFPWFNISIIGALLAAVLAVRWWIVRKYERHIEPLIDGDPNT